MMPLTNAQIEAAKTESQKQSERGRAEVQTAVNLLAGYQLIGHVHGTAEIRRADQVVYSGSWAECETWARAKGVWHAS